jgi:ATP-dependent RNA helicase SUPV3L1/SUV3
LLWAPPVATLPAMSQHADRPPLTAVLGPTNTGKTHLAVERMLAHGSGMIGFPLRLLARENYDRIVAAKGRLRVALVTGEERIIPPEARYFVCTVESMPLERRVEFLAVDEIQLAGDPERGHVFTDRLLRARGASETMVMGSETIRPLIRKLTPDAVFVGRPRFSDLTYSGHKKLTRLPPRSAVVVFSATDVYALAELIRRRRGGTAVVLGALSPRTRNAQVGLYQAGEVDYLVATDAIGMGLNMDIAHVAFARLVKFDGRTPRRLAATEIAQIAGRAGRYSAPGTFGTTDEASAIDPEIVERVETHSFEPLRRIKWRNPDLDFRSPPQLLRSLERRPPAPELHRMSHADDHLSLMALLGDPVTAELARSPFQVRILWDVCQIPDFRKVLSDAHLRLQGEILRQLVAPAGRLATDWMAGQVDRLERTEGDIDALMARIAHVRTWTYVSHRADWVDDAGHWQERTRAIEDRLSDALHERLTQRFVDRRTALLVRSLRREGDLAVGIAADGAVLVEGAPVGHLAGLGFRVETDLDPDDLRAVLAAARRALKDEIAARIGRIETASDADLAIAPDGIILWADAPVGRLVPGASILAPGAKALASDLMDAAQQARVARRLERRVGGWVTDGLGPLVRLGTADLPARARGIAFQLVEALGVLPRARIAALAEGLDGESRAALRQVGVELGATHAYLPALLRPAAMAARAMLLAIARGMALPARLPRPGAPSLPATEGDASFLAAIGYIPVGPRLIRVDRVDALARAAARLGRAGTLAAEPALARLVGAAPAELPEILAALGYRGAEDAEGRVTFRAARPKPVPTPVSRRAADPDGPFAKLALLVRRHG